MIRVRYLSIFLGITVCVLRVHGQHLQMDPRVHIDTLANGLTYYILENNEPKNRVELRMVVNAGSILEEDDQRGFAHFVEHMLFTGTARFPRQELVSFFEQVGMRFGADLNAYTSFDETVYMLELPTDSMQTVETGFAVLREWAEHATMSDEEINAERGVILEEWRRGRGAAGRTRDQIIPVILQGSQYEARLPIGDTLS
ncbi:MAG: insulinase family protein, partial [Rhodothermaceae bacterium]|nr:insulinase family protein [Rhodothermaceae bacterium]